MRLVVASEMERLSKEIEESARQASRKNRPITRAAWGPRDAEVLGAGRRVSNDPLLDPSFPKRSAVFWYLRTSRFWSEDPRSTLVRLYVLPLVFCFPVFGGTSGFRDPSRSER